MDADTRRRTPDHSGETLAPWMTHPVPGPFAPLDRDLSAEVCVIGAGIAGLTTAYLLAAAGRKVVVLERGAVAGGETSRTTAHLVTAIDDRYHRIAAVRGKDAARLAAESQVAAIDTIERIARETATECGLVRLDGYLFLPDDEEKTDVLEQELEAAHAAGLTDVAWADRSPRAFVAARALRFPRQAQFHPLRYLEGVARAIVHRGGRICAHSRVEDVDAKALVVTTREGVRVRAEAIVVATNAPIAGPASNDVMQAAYRTFVIAGEMPEGAAVDGEPALYWDTSWPYHYVRFESDPERQEELLLVGGEDHKTGQEDDATERWDRLEAWARARFPEMGPIRYRWSGQVQETVDGLGLNGPQGKHARVYQITGDSGIGMTNGTIGALLIADLVQGRPNGWAELYDPTRKVVRALPELVKEGANVAGQLARRVLPAEIHGVARLAPGEGAIVQTEAGKVAAYRDPDGQLHERSATCPHRGCAVAWNSAEQSWDCPCHGSRFDRYGTVITGPARGDLNPVPETAERRSGRAS